MSTQSDEELVDRVIAAPEADVRAFDLLVQRHRERVVTNCRFMTRSPDDAQDLAQEVFVKAYFALRKFEGRSSFRTWIQRIKVNHCLDFLKKQGGRLLVPLEDPGVDGRPEVTEAPGAERSMEAQDHRKRIGEVLDDMSDTLRVPLLLRDMDGFSYQEIAETMGIKLSAVKMRIKRAREEFRERFEGSPVRSPRRGRRPADAAAEAGAP